MGKNTKLCIAISIGLVVGALAPHARADVAGEQHAFFIDPSYDARGRSQINASARLISTHANIYVSDDYWNALDSSAQYRLTNLMVALAKEFDERIYPTETAFFGSEPNPGIDGDARITLMLSALKYNVGGYFDSSHEYPKSEVAMSNEREMIFINTAQFGDSSRIYAFLAHEFQHQISFNQKEKIRGVADDVWLNELRSEYAVTLLGYTSPFAHSNFERRFTSFREQPTDSLTEWKNDFPDYGQIAMFGEFLAEHWSPQVIADTLQTSATGIHSIDEALARRGFVDRFSDVFDQWMAANIYNTAKPPLHLSYTRPELAAFHVTPTQVLQIPQDGIIQVNFNAKDWEQRWYDIQGLGPGQKTLLRISLSSPALTSLRMPYLVYLSDGSVNYAVARFANGRTELQIPDVGVTVTRVVLMPSKQEKMTGFAMEEPMSAVTISIRRADASEYTPLVESNSEVAGVTPEQFGLTEGDFIRAEGDKDIFIINQFGYKRLVLSPQICLQYGHLGKRGCFTAVKVVAPAVRDAFKTSPYYTNGYTNDGKVYQLIETGEDSAVLVDLHMQLATFNIQGNTDTSVFRINDIEQRSYKAL